MIVASLPFAVMVGVFTSSSSLLPVLATREYKVDPTRSMGINGLIILCTGLLIAVFFNRESPVFLIKKYREQEAIDIMIRLRSESHETAEIRKDFNDLKQMVVEDTKSSLNIFDRKNRWSLFVVCLMKVMFVASFNLPLNLIFLEGMETKVYNGEFDYSGMILSGIRWVVMILTSFFIDFKRKKLYKISCALTGITLLLLAFNPLFLSRRFDVWTRTAVSAVVIQISSGLALGMLPDVYATEAFDTKKKPFSIAFASTIEFLAQIAFVVSFYYFDVPTFSLMCCLGFLFMNGILMCCLLPETSGLSLREARNKFYRQ